MANTYPYANTIASTLLHDTSDEDVDRNTDISRHFNDKMVALVGRLHADGIKLSFADLANEVSDSNLVDSIVPNLKGYNQMADAWHRAICSAVTSHGDLAAPIVTGVRALSSTTLAISFSKPIADTSVQDTTSFTLTESVSNEPLSVTSANLSETKRTILLTTSGVANLQPSNNGDETSLTLTLMIGDSVVDRTEDERRLANGGQQQVRIEPLTLGPLTSISSQTTTRVQLPASTVRILSIGDTLTIGGSHKGGYRRTCTMDYVEMDTTSKCSAPGHKTVTQD